MQQGTVAGPEYEANDLGSDFSDSSDSSSEDPQGIKRSTPRSGLKAGLRRSRPSWWRRYLEDMIDDKIEEHFEARTGHGDATTTEKHDGGKIRNHDAEKKNMEGEDDNEVERDLEAGLHHAGDGRAGEAVEQNTERSITGEKASRGAAEDVTDNDQILIEGGVEVNRRRVDDNLREGKLWKKSHRKITKKSKKGRLAQEVLNWLVPDRPSSSSKETQQRRPGPHSRSQGYRVNLETDVEDSKGKGKRRVNEAPPHHDDPAWKCPSQSPSTDHADHGRQMDDHSVRAIQPIRLPLVKTSLMRNLARWVFGSHKSTSVPTQKRQGRHLSYATTHGTSMQRVERLLRQGMEVERELEAAYRELQGRKGKGGSERIKVKIGKMVLRHLIGEGEKKIQDAIRNQRDEGGERRRGRSRVRDEDFGEGNNTSPKTATRNEGHRSDRNPKPELVPSDPLPPPPPSAISSLSSLSRHSPPPPPPPTSGKVGKQPSQPGPHHAEKGGREKFQLPAPTDSESSG